MARVVPPAEQGSANAAWTAFAHDDHVVALRADRETQFKRPTDARRDAPPAAAAEIPPRSRGSESGVTRIVARVPAAPSRDVAHRGYFATAPPLSA
ncbi:MAG TPA: hypothetical protein VE967_17185 [Gemmatimonadaceae bacterium]|nr:hypothetical protein [Gemmatimonadaceae bacterium]